MLSEIRAVGSEQVQGRREYPIAGGLVLYVPADTSPAWRAVNAMGVLLGTFATYAEAEAAVRENTPAGGARTPPPRTRCSTCRGRHATENCPARPGMKGDEHGKQGSGSGAPRGRGGRGPGPEASGAARRGDGGHEDLRHGRVEHREDDAVRAADVGGTVPRGGAVTSDPHSLDEYFAEVASRESVTLWDVKRAIWGDATGRDATVLALRELEAQGRIVRSGTRYHVVGAATVKLPVYVNGVELTELTERTVTVAVPEDEAPKLDEEDPAPWDDEDRALLRVPCGPPGEQARPRAGMMRSISTVASAMSGAAATTPDAPAVAATDPVVSAVNRAAGAVVDALLAVSEYPDAIIAEAEVFAKRAAKALEVARAERERAEAEERSAFEAWNQARDAREAARERVKRLERIAQGVE